jgi:hypothetical protein
MEMRCGCTYENSSFRGFLTKEEKLELLEEYKESLESEAKGVAEKIKELQKAS